jgi:hypothetical protein
LPEVLAGALTMFRLIGRRVGRHKSTVQIVKVEKRRVAPAADIPRSAPRTGGRPNPPLYSRAETVARGGGAAAASPPAQCFGITLKSEPYKIV